MKRTGLTSFALGAGLALPAAAQVPTAGLDQAKATVESWFQGYEYVPGPVQYKAVGAALGPALAALAFDPAKHPLVRARAVSAMAAWNGPISPSAPAPLPGPAGSRPRRHRSGRSGCCRRCGG